MRQTAQDLATQLLTLTTPTSVQQHTKSLLSSLHVSRMSYHAHKVSHLVLGTAIYFVLDHHVGM